jgi:hypothetical protein
MDEFITYTGNRKKYKSPVRKSENEDIEIQLFCQKEGCNHYIIGTEGYNGGFEAETGQYADLRNEGWVCDDHIEEHKTKLESLKISK